MKCPACKRLLVEYSTPSCKIDICQDGCAGIWFDAGEFEQSKHYTVEFPRELLCVKKVLDVLIDRSKLRQCPRCDQKTMTRLVLDPETRLEIDQCPTCKGHWLDRGELAHIRREDEEMTKLLERIEFHKKKLYG